MTWTDTRTPLCPTYCLLVLFFLRIFEKVTRQKRPWKYRPVMPCSSSPSVVNRWKNQCRDRSRSRPWWVIAARKRRRTLAVSNGGCRRRRTTTTADATPIRTAASTWTWRRICLAEVKRTRVSFQFYWYLRNFSSRSRTQHVTKRTVVVLVGVNETFLGLKKFVSQFISFRLLWYVRYCPRINF